MKLGFAAQGRGVRWLGKLLAALMLFHVAADAAAKLIRLRSGEIHPQAPAARSLAADAPVSGLFLIQFTNSVKAEWREELAGMGVELLKYVPDDTFVARLRNVSLNRVRGLGFVQWAGEYNAGHKLHRVLRSAAGRSQIFAPVEVGVLLAPKLAADELAEARQLFLTIREESKSRFGGIIRGTVSAAGLDALAGSGGVLWVEPDAKMRLFDEVAAKVVGGNGGTHLTLNQAQGFNGSNVTVAVVDSGLQNGNTPTMHPDMFGRVTGFLKYGGLTNAADEYGHGTHVAGIIAGNGATGETDAGGALYGLGIASGANIVAQRGFDATGGDRLPTPATLAVDALLAGATIGCNSWGTNTFGDYDTRAMQFDGLVRDADGETAGDQPYILVFAAGNLGSNSQTIASPALGKNVIAVGASQNNRSGFPDYQGGPDTLANFSGRGPCADGRIKPDLVAPGTYVASLKSSAVANVPNSTPISSNYVFLSGTSQAAPQVAGAAAVFLQYYRASHSNATPSPALVKAALVNAARDMTDVTTAAPTPNMNEGWGRVDLTPFFNSQRAYDFVDQATPLTNSQFTEHGVVVGTSARPLRITMAYTDVPGNPAAAKDLVNDLDLEVVSPDGRVYRGNQFDGGGQSVPDATTADSTNNVEGVLISAPLPGKHIVRVRATNVADDALADTPEIDQDFALAISGEVLPPDDGLIFMDRPVYRASDKIKITVVDLDLAGSNSVAAVAKSTTETSGENIVLISTASSGVFTGAVMTASGAAVADGQLQISHGDTITVTFFDVTAGTNRSATAIADLQPPFLSNVSITNLFGRTLISWQSSELSTSLIFLGTNYSLAPASSNLSLALDHSFFLDGLTPGTTYYFQVVSADAVGNAATNNNGGVPYAYVVPSAPPVLLVDAYVSDTNSPVIPLSAYTNALNQTGIGYEVWPALDNNALPTILNLRAYRVVFWRVSDSYYATSPFSTLGTNEQAMIGNYVNGGGSFLMTSMEILTRLGDVPFRSNVLQVASFAPNSNSVSIGGNTQYFPCSDCDQDFGATAVRGQNGDPIADGVLMNPDYSNFPDSHFVAPDDWRRDVTDTFTPTAAAVPILTETNASKVVGIRYQHSNSNGTGRVVFLSFPLDTLPETGLPPNSRAGLLRSILNYLAPGTLPTLLQISNNLWQASVTLTTPGNGVVLGSGIYTSITNATNGQYSANFGGVPYYDTPAPQTNTLAAGGWVLFQGNYTFADANNNGISDAWETHYFGGVSGGRNNLTDTDNDGRTDYSEFIAGTNPTNAASFFVLKNPVVASNAAVQLRWTSAPGHGYRVEGSADFSAWPPVSGWLVALNTNMTFTLPATNPFSFFRVQVAP